MNISITLTDAQAAALEYVVGKANASITAANAQRPEAEQAPLITAEEYLQTRVAELCASYEANRLADVRAENTALIEAVLALPEAVRSEIKTYLQGILTAQQ